MNSSIDWDHMRAFLAVLEEGSLSAAGRRLGIAQPTMRASIEALETRLGSTLFTRSVRGLAPTAQARALGSAARAMGRAADAFTRAAAADAGKIAGVVRLSVSEFVGVRVLPPMLAGLRFRYPELAVEIALSNAPADLLEQEVDIAVRMSPPRQEVLVARKVAAIPICLFAHADYLARRGTPFDLHGLAGHDFIGPDQSLADWRQVEQLLPGLDRRQFVIRTDSHPAQFAALQAGLGIAAIQRPIGLACPELRAVLPGFCVATLDTWVVAHENLRHLPRIAAVFDHLVEAFTAYAQGS